MGILYDSTDEEIARLINRYIDSAYSQHGETGPPLIDRAFSDIQKDRQSQCNADVAMVSAEHYLFARSVTASTPLMIPIIGIASGTMLGYDVAKLLGVKKQVTACPTSEWSSKHSRWKLHGSSAGMWDAIHPSGPPHKVKPSGGMEGVTFI